MWEDYFSNDTRKNSGSFSTTSVDAAAAISCWDDHQWRLYQMGSTTLGGIPKKLNPSTVLLLGRFSVISGWDTSDEKSLISFASADVKGWFQLLDGNAFAAFGYDWSHATSKQEKYHQQIQHLHFFTHFGSLPHAALVQSSVPLWFPQFSWYCPDFGSHLT